MVVGPAPARRRRGGTVIPEVALLMAIFLMFLFGILEYSRYLFVLHILTNGARDGARFASVNVTNESLTSTVITNETLLPDRVTPYNSSTRPAFKVQEISDYVADRTGRTKTGATVTWEGVLGMIAPRTNGGVIEKVQVYPVDTAGLYTATASEKPTFIPKAQSAGSRAWNNAAFSERIAVRITGIYTPILPSFLMMGGIASVEIVMVIGSEG
jgi:hypothetical protein